MEEGLQNPQSPLSTYLSVQKGKHGRHWYLKNIGRFTFGTSTQKWFFTPSKEHQPWLKSGKTFEEYPLKGFDLGTQPPRNCRYKWWTKTPNLDSKSLQRLSTQRRLTFLISACTNIDEERCAILMSWYIPWLLLQLREKRSILPTDWK